MKLRNDYSDGSTYLWKYHDKPCRLDSWHEKRKSIYSTRLYRAGWYASEAVYGTPDELEKWYAMQPRPRRYRIVDQEGQVVRELEPSAPSTHMKENQ